MNWKTKKAIRSQVASRLKAGDSKAAVFRELTTQYGEQGRPESAGINRHRVAIERGQISD